MLAASRRNAWSKRLKDSPPFRPSTHKRLPSRACSAKGGRNPVVRRIVRVLTGTLLGRLCVLRLGQLLRGHIDAVGDLKLAHANAVEICREATKGGFIPNSARSGNWNSKDRSKPPVGAITFVALYRQFGPMASRRYFSLAPEVESLVAEHRDRQGSHVDGGVMENCVG